MNTSSCNHTRITDSENCACLRIFSKSRKCSSKIANRDIQRTMESTTEKHKPWSFLAFCGVYFIYLLTHRHAALLCKAFFFSMPYFRQTFTLTRRNFQRFCSVKLQIFGKSSQKVMDEFTVCTSLSNKSFTLRGILDFL